MGINLSRKMDGVEADDEPYKVLLVSVLGQTSITHYTLVIKEVLVASYSTFSLVDLWISGERNLP